MEMEKERGNSGNGKGEEIVVIKNKGEKIVVIKNKGEEIVEMEKERK